MRKLLTACCSLAAAVVAAYYFLSAPGSFTAAGAACILTAVLFFLRKRDRLFLSLFLIALGAAVGFTAYGIHWNGTIRHAEAWDGEEQMIPVRVMENEPNLNMRFREDR